MRTETEIREEIRGLERAIEYLSNKYGSVFENAIASKKLTIETLKCVIQDKSLDQFLAAFVPVWRNEHRKRLAR